MTALLDGGFRFENFVVGASNRLAHSAAQRVADAPGAAYNPLFIYGAPGLGKTHLAAAIAYHARQAHPSLRVALESAEDVVAELERAVASGQRDLWVARCSEVDLLVLDDVQGLTGRRETQTELLRLVNRMQAGGRQLVMTSDRPPAEIPDVDERLASRLAGGLVVDVGTPDYELRLAILRNAAAARALPFATDVLEEVARVGTGSVRELKGALNRLLAVQQVEGASLAAVDVPRILGDPLPATSGARAAVRVAAAPIARAAPAVPPVADRSAPDAHWRARLAAASDAWRRDGYDVQLLERARQWPVAPDVDGLLAAFAAAADRLRGLEMQAVTLDPGMRGHPAFRDPARTADAQRLLERALASAMPLPGPRPGLTRATFEAGEANRLALAAADAVILEPGRRFNPLVLHGPAGSGKTHLAHAIAASLLAARPRLAVACLSAGTFADEFVAAMQEGGVERWRARYRGADVLVLDDVHRLAGKERTQDELFLLFNELQAREAQLVFTADRAPRDLRGLADRLRSRLEGGLVMPLHAPDRALRERVAHARLARDAGRVDEALVAYLADRDVPGLGDLVALVRRLTETASRLGVSLDLPLARRELEGDGAAMASMAPPGTTPADGGLDPFFLDAEKIVWDWPDLADRLAEAGA